MRLNVFHSYLPKLHIVLIILILFFVVSAIYYHVKFAKLNIFKNGLNLKCFIPSENRLEGIYNYSTIEYI